MIFFICINNIFKSNISFYVEIITFMYQNFILFFKIVLFLLSFYYFINFLKAIKPKDLKIYIFNTKYLNH